MTKNTCSQTSLKQKVPKENNVPADRDEFILKLN